MARTSRPLLNGIMSLVCKQGFGLDVGRQRVR